MGTYLMSAVGAGLGGQELVCCGFDEREIVYYLHGFYSFFFDNVLKFDSMAS